MVDRDSDFAKQVSDEFKAVEKKYQKKITVNIVNAKLVEDHLLPMMVVQDRHSGDIIT